MIPVTVLIPQSFFPLPNFLYYQQSKEPTQLIICFRSRIPNCFVEFCRLVRGLGPREPALIPVTVLIPQSFFPLPNLLYYQQSKEPTQLDKNKKKWFVDLGS